MRLIIILMTLFIFISCGENEISCFEECQTNASCNSEGSCQCDTGYTLVGDICKDDLHLCDDITCQINSSCKNTTGVCECDNGYTLNNGKCEGNSHDLCENKNCQTHSTCNSNNGNCECDNGYILDDDICRVENGTKLNPFMISTFPYNHNGNTETSNERNLRTNHFRWT